MQTKSDINLLHKLCHSYHDRNLRSQEIAKTMARCKSNPNSILLISNDYLSLAGNTKITASQINALKNNQKDLLMSAVFLKEATPQRQFEQNMAQFLQTEDTLLCQSGWCANVGLIQAIADEKTIVYIDRLAHMSLWEGIHSSGARVSPFRHNSVEDLESLIKKHGPGIVVVDSIYSTTGTLCPLKEIAKITNSYDCILVVDESHSLGTHGNQGQGLVASLNLNKNVHFITASLAKSFCGRGGIIACSKQLAEYVKYTSRPSIFSSTFLAYEIAGFQKTLEIIQQAHNARKTLQENADYIRNHLNAMGYNVDASQSQIIALEAGTEQSVRLLKNILESHHIFGAPFVPPATSKNRCCLRLSIHASLQENQLKHIINTCYQIRQDISLKILAINPKKKTTSSDTKQSPVSRLTTHYMLI